MALIKLKQLDTILTGSLQVSGSSGVTGSLDVDTNIVAGNRVTSDYGTVNYSLVVNEAGHGGGDLRVESVNNAYQIFSDSNQDKVGIGTNSLTSLLMDTPKPGESLFANIVWSESDFDFKISSSSRSINKLDTLYLKKCSILP